MKFKYRGQVVALVIPCHNEGLAIGKVVSDFNQSMPELSIYVFDNDSSDNTSIVAKSSGANVVSVSLRGKGNVVRRMFADIEADVYVMVDGDDTYDASVVRSLVDKLLDDNLDMVVGCRRTDSSIASQAYRSGHQWGNKILTKSVMNIFGGKFTDMLSGYRVFTRRYVKSFPALSKGFETETELTIHALELRMPYGEVVTSYGARPEGSASKLSTYRDGFRILKMISLLYFSERPFHFFSICSIILAFTSIVLALPIFAEFLHSGVVPRLPTAVLSASLALSSLLSFACGLILDNVTRARHEMKRLAYLAIPAPLVK